MARKYEDQEICMGQFKPAIAVLAALVVIIVGVTLWRLCPGSFIVNTPGEPGVAQGPGMGQGNARLMAPNMIITPAAAKSPMTPPIDVNAKQPHSYWGTCNKCHVTTGGGKPVSKVMAGAPISIEQTMMHGYWGNCELCHKVVDGFQPTGVYIDPASAQAQPPGRGPGPGMGLRHGMGPPGQAPALAAATAPATPGQPLASAVPQTQATFGLVAVMAFGPDLTSQVSGQFETAPYIMLINPTQRVFRVEANPNSGTEGYGVQLSQLMVNLGVSTVIAGGFSQTSLSTLGSLGINSCPGVTGTVQDALVAYQAGGLISTPMSTSQTAQRPNTLAQGVPLPQAVMPSQPQTLY